jgi:hypothetical protein
MIQCPTCGYRTFCAGLTVYGQVRLTGQSDGDYTEQEIYPCDREWHQLTCERCAAVTDEKTARQAFDAEALDADMPDEIYEWLESWCLAYPKVDHPANESASTIAGAWNLWVWRQERRA